MAQSHNGSETETLIDRYGAIDFETVEEPRDWDPALVDPNDLPQEAPDGRRYTVAAWDGGYSDMPQESGWADVEEGSPVMINYVSNRGGVQTFEGEILYNSSWKLTAINGDGEKRTVTVEDDYGRENAVQGAGNRFIGTMLDIRVAFTADFLETAERAKDRDKNDDDGDDGDNKTMVTDGGTNVNGSTYDGPTYAGRSEEYGTEDSKYDYRSQDPNAEGPFLLEDFKPEFQADIREASELSGDEAVHKWSMILKDHVQAGNNKIADTTLIFNFGSATDCPNRGTPNCQVPWESCYAGKSERLYGTPLAYRRRQEYLRDSVDADTFAAAMAALIGRKRKPVDTLRLSEAGDFRSNADILWADRVAAILKDTCDIDTYTYSASNYLNWSLADQFTVNASNDLSEYGDRRFMAVEEIDDVPDGAVVCPNDAQKRGGKPSDEAIKCGECRLCVNPEGPDVAILIH